MWERFGNAPNARLTAGVRGDLYNVYEASVVLYTQGMKMKKTILMVTAVTVLFIATAGAALASHDITKTAAPVPAHGSVWHGSGLERYDVIQLPAHGSIWYGSGLDQYDHISVPIPVHGIESFGERLGH